MTINVTRTPLVDCLRSSEFDFRALLSAGDTVAWPQGSGEPLGLTTRLVAQRHNLPRIDIFIGMSTSRTVTADVIDRFRVRGLNGAGMNRHLTAAGVLEIIPTHVSAVPALLRSKAFPVDVALVRVRPHPLGGLTVGVVTDYTRALIDAARYVVGEIDERLPLTAHDARIPYDVIDHFVLADGEETLLPDPEPSETEMEVARRVAAFIPERATLQLGIGSLPVAVGRALLGHRDLGFHSGVASDVLVDLIERGVVTNRFKGIDVGESVTGCLFGTRRLLDHADSNRTVAMRSIDHTHSMRIMSQIVKLHSVNSAVEIDLSGQVNAEQAGDRYLGAIGGQVDFVRGAQVSPGGRSIIALPSTTPDGKRSRIVSSLAGRPVTTARSDTDVVITEFGIAELVGRSIGERAKRLSAIAHPAFRDELNASSNT